MSKQWGHGFHTGFGQGESWSALLEQGAADDRMNDIGCRLLLLARALTAAVELGGPRTDSWWRLYVSTAAKQLEAVAQEMPTTLGGVVEYVDDLPRESGVDAPVATVETTA